MPPIERSCEPRREPDLDLVFASATTRRAALAAMARAFAAAGIDAPERDARAIAAGILECNAVQFIAEPDVPIGTCAAALAAAVNRRTAREPVSRILGRRGFFGRDFIITPATLDPRPDSECLIETALAVLAERQACDGALQLLDIGTGSGCLLVTLLAELPRARGVGVDIAADAIVCARINAAALGVGGRADFIVGDGLVAVAGGPFDLVLANPPYVRTGDIDGLQPEVRIWDPLAALDGGGDGLAFYRQWCIGLNRLVPDGWVIFEVGHDQADDVRDILRNAMRPSQVADMRIISDMGGVRRCVAVRTQV